MKCQILFSQKNITNLSSAESARSMVKLNKYPNKYLFSFLKKRYAIHTQWKCLTKALLSNHNMFSGRNKENINIFTNDKNT